MSGLKDEMTRVMNDKFIDTYLQLGEDLSVIERRNDPELFKVSKWYLEELSNTTKNTLDMTNEEAIMLDKVIKTFGNDSLRYYLWGLNIVTTHRLFKDTLSPHKRLDLSELLGMIVFIGHKHPEVFEP
jgi:hypothetical protein